MVTTRSGIRVDAQDPTTKPTTKRLKRKSSTIKPTPSITPEPPAKIPKTDLTENSNVDTELPLAPAPTPVAPHSQSLSEATLPDAASTTTNPAPTTTPALVLVTSSVLPSTATEPIALVPVPAPTATEVATISALEETPKEPAPESVPLPDMLTVLEQQPPITDTIIATTDTLMSTETFTVPVATTSIPAATAPAPAPVAAPVEAPGSVAVATTSPVMPTEFHEQTLSDVAVSSNVGNNDNNGNNNTITSNGVALTSTVTTVGTAATAVPPLFPKTDNSDGDISSTVAGIDVATAAAPAPGAIGNSRGNHQSTDQVQKLLPSSSKDEQKDQAATKFDTNDLTALVVATFFSVC
ncbi:hypothetical protein BGX20_001596, partial [Mortierella sp. AD010]